VPPKRGSVPKYVQFMYFLNIFSMVLLLYFFSFVFWQVKKSQ
jgi:hypothetical protein